MHPILFRLGPITIYSYGLMVASAFLVSTFLASRRARDLGIQPGKIVDLGVCLLISGLAGARLFYVILNSTEFVGHPLRAINLSYPGLVFYGGIIFGLPAGILFLRKNRLETLRILDLVAPYVALGQSIGRLGCFLYGCCYGVATSSVLGVYFPGREEAVFPVQIYSGFVCLVLFIFLRHRQEKSRLAGGVFLEYLIYYSTARFLLEFLRGDTAGLILNLSLFQMMSIVILIVSAGGWFVLGKRHRENKAVQERGNGQLSRLI